MRPLWLLSAILMTACLGAPGPATASVCFQISPAVAAKDPQAHVFVGTVVETQAFDQNALFHVEEIWYGGSLPEWQAVQGVDTDHEIWSTSTLFAVGTRYLVVAMRDGLVLKNHCGGTGPYGSEVDAERPPKVVSPSASERPHAWGVAAGPPWPLLGLGAAGLYVAGAGWWLLRRGRRGPDAV